MATILTKAEFALYVDIPGTLPESKLTRHIQDAAIFELEPAFNSTKLYRAIVQSDIVAESALDDFYKNYVRPFWVYAAFCAFELRHGIDVTQAGMKEHTDNNSENITDKRRSDLLNSDRSKLNVYRSRMLKELETQNRTFDSEAYPADTIKHQKQQGHQWRIHAVTPHRNIPGDGCREDRFGTGYYGGGGNSGGGKIDYNGGDYN